MRIPDEILSGSVGHDEPYRGDHGITYESLLPDLDVARYARRPKTVPGPSREEVKAGDADDCGHERVGGEFTEGNTCAGEGSDAGSAGDGGTAADLAGGPAAAASQEAIDAGREGRFEIAATGELAGPVSASGSRASSGLTAAGLREKMLAAGFAKDRVEGTLGLLEARAGVLGVSLDDYIGKRIIDFSRESADAYFGDVEPKVDRVLRRFKDAALVTPAEAFSLLGSRVPEYLAGVRQFIDGQFEKYREGSFKPREVAKSLVATAASQGTSGMIPRNLFAKLGEDTPFSRWMQAPEQAGWLDKVTEGTGIDGLIRPEEAVSAWFMSPAGKKALDNLDAGHYNAADWEEARAIRAAMGDDRLGPTRPIRPGEKDARGKRVKTGLGIFQPSKRFRGGRLLSRDKKGRLVGRLGLDGIPEITRMINEAGRSGDMGGRLSELVATMRGVGEAKNGFIMHFFGIPSRATFDAVEMNFWMMGIGDTKRMSPAYQERYEQLSDKVKSQLNRHTVRMVQELKELSNNPRVSKALVSRLGENLEQLQRDLQSENPELNQHVLHHWLWDVAKGSITSHAGMYEAVRLAQRHGDTFRGMVEFDGEGRAAVRAFESGNISTIVHELGHVFRRDMTPAEEATAREWVGLGPDEEWDEEAEEHFARGFEAYLHNGSLPKDAPGGLKNLFEKFKSWLAEVYKNLTNSPIAGTGLKESKKVFDAMLSPASHGRLEAEHRKPAEQAAKKEAQQEKKRVAAEQKAARAREREEKKRAAEEARAARPKRPAVARRRSHRPLSRFSRPEGGVIIPSQERHLSADQVGEIIADQHHNRPHFYTEDGERKWFGGYTAEAARRHWISSSLFTLTRVPTWTVAPYLRVTGNDPSFSKGPIIVDINKRKNFDKIHGSFGSTPDIVILDGKHRHREMINSGDSMIEAYVGDRAAERVQKLAEDFGPARAQFVSALNTFYDRPSRDTEDTLIAAAREAGLDDDQIKMLLMHYNHGYLFVPSIGEFVADGK